MPGNRVGGLKTARKNLAKDPDFYRKLGKLGGKKSRGGGFAYVDEDGNEIGKVRAAVYGKIGGTKSRRSGVKNAKNA